MDSLRYLGDVQRLTLRPGDAIVLTTGQSIPDDVANRVRGLLEAEFPGHKAVVLSGDMHLGVMSPTDSTIEERIEAKLDTLIASLAGGWPGRDQGQSQSLG